MIARIEDYFADGCGRCPRFATTDCATRIWGRGLGDLRRICLAAGLAETVKWGHPCYVHAGRNIVILGAFRADFRISFFNAALLRDPSGVMERQGPNTRSADMIRFADPARVAALEPVILAYLKEAMGYAEADITPPKASGTIALPDELRDALDADPAFSEAFHALTPGRQKSCVIHLNTARTSATRVSRIAGFRENVLAGKGATGR